MTEVERAEHLRSSFRLALHHHGRLEGPYLVSVTSRL